MAYLGTQVPSYYLSRNLLALILTTIGTLLFFLALLHSVFHLASREEILLSSGELSFHLVVLGYRRNRTFATAALTNPRVEVRRYLGKHGTQYIRRLAFEHRGRRTRNSRNLTEEEARQVQTKIVRHLLQGLPPS